MKYTMSAAVALCLAVGLAAGAQAHGFNRQSANQPTKFQRAAMSQQMSKKQIIQEQRQLKAEGLYRGKINGILNRGTRLAMNREQGRTGLRQTAMVHRTARHHQVQPQTNVGSSTPPKMNNTTQAPNAGNSNGTQQ